MKKKFSLTCLTQNTFFSATKTLVKKKPSISFYYYLKQTVEYIETMNQEWDSNPGPCSI